MAEFQRHHVSRLVPTKPKILSALLLAVAIVNSATLGYDSPVMNGLLILPQCTEYFQLTTATTGLNTTASWIGSIIGAFLIQPIPDYFGRRRAILIASGLTVVGIAPQAAAQNAAIFAAARIVVGIGSSISNGAAPTLLGELLPAQRRGRVLGLCFSCFYIDSLLSAVVNLGSNNIVDTWAWRLPSLLQIVPSLLAVALLPFLPESPRWLLSRGRREEALGILIIIQNHGRHDTATTTVRLDEIERVTTLEAAEFPQNPLHKIMAPGPNRRHLIILCSFGPMVNMFGNFIISYYLSNILDQAGVTDTTKVLSLTLNDSC